jgi:signal transduction histidine kinase
MTIPTQFAPAKRASEEEIKQQSLCIESDPDFKKLVNSVPNIILILNKERQTVFCNQSLLGLLNVQDLNWVRGQRPGELINCIHSRETEGGCGTTEYCKTCGAVLSILTTQNEGKRDARECRITCAKNEFHESLDFRVWTDRITINDEQFIVFSIVDISDEKRRKVLERIFFHDIRNTAGNLLICMELMKDKKLFDSEELLEMMYAISSQLMSEIDEQQQLLAAENNELKIQPAVIRPGDFIKEILSQYKGYENAKGKHLQTDFHAPDTEFTSDETLLKRVVGNMLKNALEASKPGDTVIAGCDASDGRICLWVHNPAVIPKDIQLQIFQRSFSTKGSNRGIGTYSMKLLTERYLKGKIYFTSSEEKGTVFTAEYPMRIDN